MTTLRDRAISLATISLSAVLLSGSLGWVRPVYAQSATRFTCPAEVEPLVNQLVIDLPGYANRISNRLLQRHSTLRHYIVLAGRPEFEPLPLAPGQTVQKERSNDPRQVFITTLERQYQDRQTVQIQEFHWLFLTQSADGWRLALIFSRTGTYPADQPPTPPRDSSQGIIAQAIRTWLRDCNLGAVRKRT